MGFLRKLFGEKKQPTLKEDLHKASVWIAEALNTSGYGADWSLESFREIDRFFEEQSTSGGLLDGKCGRYLFALGGYIGETLICTYGGEWMTDDSDPQGEINVAVRLPGNSIVWPVQRAMKRRQNGAEDGIYAYGVACGDIE